MYKAALFVCPESDTFLKNYTLKIPFLTDCFYIFRIKTGKKGRPRKCGDGISLDDIVLGEPESGDWENSADKTICSYGAENVFYLLMAWYGLRWNIEASYYQALRNFKSYKLV